MKCPQRTGMFDGGGRHPRWTLEKGPWKQGWVWGRDFYRRTQCTTPVRFSSSLSLINRENSISGKSE